MMESVADNEHPPPGAPDAEPTPPAGLPAARPEPPGELSVRRPDVPAAPPIDPEAVRQFQEFQQFQQFQELLRQQQEQGFPQGTPPPPGSLQPWGPPPKQRPWWQRTLRSIAGKIATAAIVVLLLAGVGWFAIDYFLGGPPEQPRAHEIGGGKTEDRLLFETDPRNAVQKIYDDIAQGDPESACQRFTPDARAEFADHLHSYGASCEEIVREIHTTVADARMKDEYANPDKLSTVTVQPTDEPVTVSSCALGVEGGPALGALTVAKIPGSAGGDDPSVGGQYIVTEHAAEPADCAGVPTAPPTS
jgi:hypothetical protein